MNEATCAHLNIRYRTRASGDGTISSWWECDNDCGMSFRPNVYEMDKIELELENFMLREIIEDELHLSNFGIDAVLRERIAGNKRELR